MRVRSGQVLLVSCLLYCSVAFDVLGSGPPPVAAPEGPPRQRLTGLPGPGGAGLLPIEDPRPARTHADLDLAVEIFLFEVIDRTRERIAWKEIGFRSDMAPILMPSSAAYGALVMGGGSSGVVIQPPANWDPGPAGAALVLGVAYLTEGGQRTLRACRTFLEARGDALRTFWASCRGADGEPVSPDLLAAVEQRKAEIRSYPPCRGLLPPMASEDAPVVRSSEGPR